MFKTRTKNYKGDLHSERERFYCEACKEYSSYYQRVSDNCVNPTLYGPYADDANSFYSAHSQHSKIYFEPIHANR